jgi:hypothetical protein
MRIWEWIKGRRICFTWNILRTGYTKESEMETSVPKLNDAWCEAFEASLPGGKFAEKDGATHCNEAVNYVAKKMGYSGFDDLRTKFPDDAILANAMFELMVLSPDWMQVDGTVAQAHANEGALVVAAWKSPAGVHGHVAVIRPGNLTHSTKWGNLPPDPPRIPKVANIGKAENRFIARGANWAFGEEPKYFVLKAMV